jgi:receptor protein-tyrosine kinase
MSRVHDALRKAATEKTETPRQPPPERPERAAVSAAIPEEPEKPRPDRAIRAAVSEALLAEPYIPQMDQPVRSVVSDALLAESQKPQADPARSAFTEAVLAESKPRLADPSANQQQRSVRERLADQRAEFEKLDDVILCAPTIPFSPAPAALLVDPAKPKDAPSEEFRSLRTRLNHLQRDQPLHTLVVTSASPGEGKSFTACNLAICEAQLSGKKILLADFDFRRPSIDKIFGINGKPGITDFLTGKAGIQDLITRVEGTNLYILAAGGSVPNPLELLNLRQCSALIEALRDHFDWVILDSPPLLFAADGNLLSTMADGTILVVRIGSTTYDSVTRALQSLCENNVLGIVVNGANRAELYSKYAYYHSFYTEPEERVETDKPLDLESVGARD